MSARTATKPSVSLTSQVTVDELGDDCCISSARLGEELRRRASPTTVAPRAAMSRAKRRPRPDDAPVTTATAPRSSNMAILPWLLAAIEHCLMDAPRTARAMWKLLRAPARASTYFADECLEEFADRRA